MACLIGTGRNGKSVVYETINGILGTDNVSSIEITSLTESNNKEYNIASINGKMLNYCSDMSKKTIQSSSFKSIISGEKQLARFPYGKPFDALDIPLMVLISLSQK
jgi:phage/plasmid-associated DNA primase